MSKRDPPDGEQIIEKKLKRNANKKQLEESNNLFASYVKLTTKLPESDLYYFRDNLDYDNKKYIVNELITIQNLDNDTKPKIIKLLESSIPLKFKSIALKKILQLENSKDFSGKLEFWLDSFLRIPFNTLSQLPITLSDGPLKCKEFMENCDKTLNECTYGMIHAKNQLLQLIGKWIVNPKSMGTAIALKGPMGTGKTTLIKNGISKILNRPFAFIALGGTTDGCYLEGHSFTYEGSMYGKIIDILIQSKCSNPVIFFDELDKVSQTDKGTDIIGILTHLTDTTQNNQFHDKYFSEFDFDLSKCLFIFSYNNEEFVNPILKDRMYTIDISGYTIKEKIKIALNYLLPEIIKEYNMEGIIFTETIIEYIIENTEKEQGVRCLKRSLETICSKLNLKRILENYIYTQELTIEAIQDMLNIKEKEQTSYINMYL